MICQDVQPIVDVIRSLEDPKLSWTAYHADGSSSLSSLECARPWAARVLNSWLSSSAQIFQSILRTLSLTGFLFGAWRQILRVWCYVVED